MRACIIVPPSPFLDDDKIVHPLGPMYIKRYVQENSDHTVEILDECESNFSEYDVVGFSAVTANVKYIEKFLPINGKITVIGGPHITFYRNDLSEKIRNNISYIIPGDGCKPFLSILNEDVEIKYALDDTNQLPWRDVEIQNKYQYLMYGLNATNMITSRGCPNKCYFCEDANTQMRFKDIESIEKELVECKQLGYEFISLSDDMFCITIKRITKIAKLMKKYNLKFRCLCRANTFTAEMASVLSEHGCLEVGFGAESGSQKILDIINKNTTVEQIKKTINLIKQYNMVARASFMIGLPGETHETLDDTYDLIKESTLDDFIVFIYHPYRGTYIYDNVELFDIILPSDYDDSMHLLGKSGSVKSCGVFTKDLSSVNIFKFHQKINKLKSN